MTSAKISRRLLCPFATRPLALATHDSVIREALLASFAPVSVEMLLGVRSSDARSLTERGVPVRL
jgi:proline dehydrogenase